MEPHLILSAIVIGFAAIEDWKTRNVQNEAVGLLWLIVWVFNVNIAMMAGVFAVLLIAFAMFHKYYTKQTVFNFGDILIFPPVYALIWSFGVAGLALLAAALVGFLLVAVLKRKPMAFVPYLAVVLFFCCYLSYVQT